MKRQCCTLCTESHNFSYTHSLTHLFCFLSLSLSLFSWDAPQYPPNHAYLNNNAKNRPWTKQFKKSLILTMECFSRRTHIHIWSTSLSIEIDYISTIFSLSLSLSLSKQNKRQSNVLCEVVTWEVFRCPLTFF